MEQKLKTYIDTSVLNVAFEKERAESIITHKFFQLLKSKSLNPVISDLVQAEINAAPDLRKNQILQILETYKIEKIDISEESYKLAEIYIKEKLIPASYFNDALHIAVATTARCAFLASWNFKHIVRAKVIRGVHLINLREGYGLIELVAPSQITGEI